MFLIVLCVYVSYVLTSLQETGGRDIERQVFAKTNPDTYEEPNKFISINPSSTIDPSDIPSQIMILLKELGFDDSAIQEVCEELSSGRLNFFDKLDRSIKDGNSEERCDNFFEFDSDNILRCFSDSNLLQEAYTQQNILADQSAFSTVDPSEVN
ncbi:hypothetical protein EDEG_03367 [Edhazardia aedis USNM 41457]|uniref:UBA domain-containing protein n=1 Tax=Edhazardia aedis (strain USNM 41457) TaxID=1003232 RepID=J9D2Z9_EDHAE|nr:hypothetical protein EDEG_03367 [Edhazardia aedis USNM 41457]|eukprot:EJW02191.1 hypothetical protein EDEG_03367 [Edhazardia aedis USNM 41457]